MKINYTYLVLFILLLAGACKKDNLSNPFDEVENNVEEETEEVTLDPTSLAGLHANIFRPTCANSGCHDGTFEPDFRTIQSSYNTLVGHTIIKNDPQGSFEYRVVAGNPSKSQLMARLTIDIDGNSGIMPLVTEPDSDWNERSTEYIDNVRQWIQNGAPND